jgi:ADP-heptose:LPS heptosyltransferase
MTHENVQKIAVIRRNGFGDILCTIPLILYCKKKWPKSIVTLFVEERVMCLAPYLVGPDVVKAIPNGKNKYFSAILLALKMRKERFDLAFSAKTSPMKLMNVFLFALGAKKRFAYTGNSFDSLLVNRNKKETASNIHQALKIIQLLDPKVDAVDESLYPKLKGVKKRDLGVGSTLFYSVSNNRVGSTLAIERAAYLLNKLNEKRKACTIINSMPVDVERAKKLSTLLNGSFKIAVTERFVDFLELLNSCDASFVGDGGICHLASALDKPFVALYGGIPLSEWMPMSRRAVCFESAGHVDLIDEEKILSALFKIRN